MGPPRYRRAGMIERMHWSPSQLAAATAGRLVESIAGERDAVVTSVTIDSRLVRPGGLFVPIVASRDGHAFLQDAIDHGAAAVIFATGQAPTGVPAIQVADTSVALLDLGRAARGRLDGPVVGITGSVGKTSTKDLAATALGRRWVVAASERSFNNELGVPLTLVNAGPDTGVTVLEMGARGPGHIRLLCEVARPTIGVVTAVAAAHTDSFRSLDAIAAAKGELIEALPEAGTAVLNADDERVAAMARRTSAPVLRYSAAAAGGADIVASQVSLDKELRARFVLRSPWGSAAVHLGARGLHQVGNALAAGAVALRCDVPVGEVAVALEQAVMSPWRMQLERTRRGAFVLNDAYNANPASMAASLQALVALPATRRVAVVGLMAELGDLAVSAHQEAAELAASLGIELIVVGTDLYGVPPVDGVDGALAALRSRLGGDPAEGDAVLVKASRVVGLEQLAAQLLDS
ncbi:MAG: UDP-N-acetylmuramoyl-tripeptide--D-alanyl-D-alanine ligase [Acidimicrobiaceae bacterium]|nr:UDP-N-acetylmuramoyl-tripeptide--D-alanyl-D-alanine ligase [Acidimicrobiaceae bacterium]